MKELHFRHAFIIAGIILNNDDYTSGNLHAWKKILSLPQFKEYVKQTDKKTLEKLIGDSSGVHNSDRDKLIKESKLYISYLSYTDRFFVCCLVIDIIRFLKKEEKESLYEQLSELHHIIDITQEDTNALINFWIKISGAHSIGKNKIKILIPPHSKDPDTLEGNWVESNFPQETSNHLPADKLTGKSLIAMFHEKTSTFLLRCTEDIQILKNHEKIPDAFVSIAPGDIAEFKGCAVLSYRDLKTYFVHSEVQVPLEVEIAGVEYRIRSKQIISPFSLTEEQGNLIGVIGNEGSGKSSLLKLIAGKIFPSEGKVFINGYDLKQNQFQLKSLIGYVPEEDLLFDELTVYENIYLSGRLFLSKFKKKELEKKINTVLEQLDIADIKNTAVGKTGDKRIQPGQRRLVNIALELIRDPSLLIVDNALAPLSMSDASKVLLVLHKLSLKGKLVFTSICQTNMDTFLNFDKILLLNKTGQVLFYGPPEDTGKFYHGNINERANALLPDKLLWEMDSVEKRFPEYINSSAGKITYKDQKTTNTLQEKEEQKRLLPGNLLHTPTLHRQYFILCLRNFKSKLSFKKELIFIIGSSLLISVLFSLLCRYKLSEDYVYGTNPNMPIFIFGSIIINFFLGLLLSSKEIIRERNIIEREEYHNINKFSYINSKITYLFIIGAILSFIYVIVANPILKVPGFILISWAVYGSSLASGILLGLLFSSYFKNYESILTKAIPIALLFQILLSGALITIPKLSDKEYTPLLCDIAPARWSFEALMVDYFCNNKYQKIYLKNERSVKNTRHVLNTLIPTLENKFDQLIKSSHTSKNDKTVNREISELLNTIILFNDDIFPFEFRKQIENNVLTDEIIEETYAYIEYLKYFTSEKLTELLTINKNLEDSLRYTLGTKGFRNFRSKNQNQAIESMVSHPELYHSFSSNQNKAPTDYAIYQPPTHNFGKSRIFQSQKKFNHEIYNTPLFNISVLWIFNLGMYLALIFIPSRFRNT